MLLTYGYDYKFGRIVGVKITYSLGMYVNKTWDVSSPKRK